MKIKKIKWKNHPVLGNLEIDLTNPTTGIPFNTILFAGENGTGKTTILETLSTFLNRGSFEPFEYIEYVAEGKVYSAVHHGEETILDFFNVIDDAGQTRPIRSNFNNRPETIEADKLDLRHYGCVFSKARADYKTDRITATTAKELDVEKYIPDNEDNFTSLKQLIIDIQNQDSDEYMEVNRRRGANPQSWDDYYLTSKTYRFKNAFDTFFQNLKYDKVVNDNLEKSIRFTKNGNSISIDKLSTGEKQIVFRGTFLLRNFNKLEGATILIDEPELSMHPKWQQKILSYYQQLFTQAGVQRAQLFLATHSEYVLEEALSSPNENLVIVLNEVAGGLTSSRIVAPFVLPSITAAETNYVAFDVVSNDYHIELYGRLQNKELLRTVKDCDSFIRAHPLYDPALHSKPSLHPNGRTTYDTLSTYIRNAIDHPDPAHPFTVTELRTSIQLLIELCR